MLIPLWLEISPPTNTLHLISVSFVSITSNDTLPSSISTLFPLVSCDGKSL